MKKICTMLFMLNLVSCKDDNVIFEIDNLNRDMITVLGHGGMGIGSTYPMNTFESIINCINLGSDGSEIDVQMTSDGVLVAFHDFDLSVKTNLQGVVNAHTWEELRNGYYNETPYMRYALVSLDQIFSNIEIVENYKFTFDCKLYRETTADDAYFARFADAIIAIAEKYGLQRRICIESNDKNFLGILQQKAVRYKLFIYPDDFNEGLAIAKSMGLYGITVSTNQISAEDVKAAHEAGVRVAVWDARSEQENRDAVQKNPDFIQTDNVKYLVNLLGPTIDLALERKAARQDSLLNRKKLTPADTSSQIISMQPIL
ncbi:glycerophosphodiester phosphodiesterase family protein [Emticicia sp. 21SJ11W-3]|uniref:glycerophosphodiester phosphodiesterase n=1 Tax=Emticicia sp. 21SJ11W-3 TaxID=2916755 RepID=UPI0020A1B831|nr:glycerophosphodiester phosphodiesterase family protein [Emticicia sp. 21SJ11W-3]UTA69701.1 hypothetical protein MB380_07800 [Emticicia sp. 21SJ11W-3]